MIVECEKCGASNEVTLQYSPFGPANQEKESAFCEKCNALLGRYRCLSVDVTLIDDTPSAV